MREAILKKNYARAFKRVVILAVLLALCRPERRGAVA